MTMSNKFSFKSKMNFYQYEKGNGKFDQKARHFALFAL